jgi:hypothetical protein
MTDKQMTDKQIYVIRGSKNEAYPAFRGRILEKLNLVKDLYEPTALWVTMTTGKPPRYSIIPFKKVKIAAVSVKRETPALLAELTGMPGFAGAYSVEEAVPVAHEKTWPDGTSTPGVNLLTLFNKKPGLDGDTFIHRWHNGHTPLSLKIHPLWNYNRNVVKEKLTEKAAPYDGIVEEQVRTREELLNPFRFFGNALIIIPRMLMVYFDTKSFLDYKNIETYLAEEVIIKS